MSTASFEPVLALPDGCLIDDLARARLDRALAAQGPEVAGVVARLDRPPPGASYRSHAERQATRPPDDLRPTTEQRIEGAVLLRAGRGFGLADGSVTIDEGHLLTDPGAVAHDPWQELGPLEDASPDGRSPFPYRPVVLLLGIEHDALLADWGRAVVNGLIRSEAEGRLAVPAPTEGLHLASPCRPSAATVRALRPDVLVALEPEALDLATSWLDADGNRSTVTVLLTPGTEAEPDLVSWRIGEARGRLRARIGRGTKGAVLADLARRLATGPVPIGPADGHSRPDGQRLLNPRRALNRTPKGPPLAMLALVDPASADTTRRFETLFGHIAPPTHTAIEPLADPLPSGALTADVLLLAPFTTAGDATTPALDDLVRARSSSGRTTIIDVAAATSPSPAQEDLLRLARLATTTDQRSRDQLVADLAVRAFTLPTLLPGRRADELAARGEQAVRMGRDTIGCDVRDTSEPVQLAVREALVHLLDRRPELRLRLLATEPGPLTDLVERGAVSLTTTPPRPDEMARWVAALTTTDLPTARHWPGIAESQLVGVPTICPAHHPAARDGLVVAPLTISDPAVGQRWRRVLDDLLDGPGIWERRSADALATATALYGPASSRALVDRFVGWLRFGAGS